MRVFLCFIATLISLTSFSQEKKVMICKGSSAYAYHSRYCQGLKHCKADIESISLKQAEDLGRKPCGYCMKRIGGSTGGKKVNAEEPIKDGRCIAKTKKGTRCTRKANSNGYCWQHG